MYFQSPKLEMEASWCNSAAAKPQHCISNSPVVCKCYMLFTCTETGETSYHCGVYVQFKSLVVRHATLQIKGCK